MRKVLSLLKYLVLLLLLAGVTFAGFWLGLVPQRWSPFGPLELDKKPGWFLDAQLATLRRDPALCLAVLKAPYIEAAPVADQPFTKQCGWRNAVRVSSAGGTRLAVEPLTCEMAAAVALWITYELQPAAVEGPG